MSRSEVQQLREQIEREMQAMNLGLSGVAAGVAKHQFIEARMQRIGQFEDQLAQHIGQHQATLFSCQAYMQQMKEE